ncbi:hypothetical protein QYE76_032024 [Lolium multiflorum]|uniref:Uncharacterized protein n=1 Tax=Lolium multiflorum TaxID=4521 RepID=A0AAD8QU87_LOLMU|nr:hypothetical protein QYE76_032024 [Lolium multiflorum]
MVDTSNQKSLLLYLLLSSSTIQRKPSRSEMAFHLRSISLPSRPQANEAEVEQELLSLEASISSSTTIGTMCDGLRRLGDIYNGVEEIIGLPSNQVGKMLNGEMDSSLELLDLCSIMQEIFVEMKAIIQELQAALRKGDDAAVQANILSYTRLAKKAKKLFKKTTKKATSAGCRMVMLFTKAREISVSLLESSVHLLSKEIDMPKQSLVSKVFHKKKAVVCEEDLLQELECSIGDLENAAGHLFRKLVHIRVSLLNILSS